MPPLKTKTMRHTPTCRAEFERNLDILREILRQGRLRLPAGMPIDSFLRARELPNGRIDFTSVDEQLRLMANTMAEMSEDMPGPTPDGDDEPESE